jgi:hypothetical protein
MIGWYVPIERKLIEQRSLFDFPMSHHDSQSCFSQQLNQRMSCVAAPTFSASKSDRMRWSRKICFSRRPRVGHAAKGDLPPWGSHEPTSPNVLLICDDDALAIRAYLASLAPIRDLVAAPPDALLYAQPLFLRLFHLVELVRRRYGRCDNVRGRCSPQPGTCQLDDRFHETSSLGTGYLFVDSSFVSDRTRSCSMGTMTETDDARFCSSDSFAAACATAPQC